MKVYKFIREINDVKNRHANTLIEYASIMKGICHRTKMMKNASQKKDSTFEKMKAMHEERVLLKKEARLKEKELNEITQELNAIETRPSSSGSDMDDEAIQTRRHLELQIRGRGTGRNVGARLR